MKMNQLGKRLAFYLGGAWVITEAFSFLVNQYDLDPGLIDLLILLILFGFPGTLIYSSFNGRLNWKAWVLQIINVVLAFSLIFYYVINPSSMSPDKLRFLKVSKDKKSEISQLNAVAVLPFLNNMGADQEYLLAGMHDGLITEIGKLGSINVTSRTSVLAQKTDGKKLQQIAKELKVDAIVETSLTRVDTMVSLQMKLINAFPEETILWSHSYEVHLGEIPNLFREVTINVAAKLDRAVTPEQEQRLSSDRTYDPDAYELYLKGMYHTGYLTPESFDQAEEYFVSAMALDSTIIEVYSGLAIVWASRRQMGYTPPQFARDTIASLFALADKIDSENATLYQAKGMECTWGTYEWKQGEVNFKKALELNPHDALSRIYYAHYLMIMNRWDEAWEQARYAEDIESESPWVVSFIGIMYAFDNKILTASKYVEKLKKIQPDHPLINEVYLEKEATFQNYDAAIEYLKKTLERTQLEDINQFIDQTYAENDFNTTLDKVSEFLIQKREHEYVLPRLIHANYMMTDNTEKQLEWMRIIYSEKAPSFPYFAVRGVWTIQENPNYEAVMIEAGLWE